MCGVIKGSYKDKSYFSSPAPPARVKMWSFLLQWKTLRNRETTLLLFFCSFNVNKDCVSGLGNARTLHNENSSRFVSDILLGQERNFNFYFAG